MNLAECSKAARHCKICEPHLPLGANPVFHVPPEAEILIAGQAPGKRVHETSLPFNDPSGDRLRDWMGLSRQTFYTSPKIAILPMGFCYPGTSKGGDLPPRKECAPAWRHLFLENLPKLKLTLAIGQYAIHWHLKTKRQKSLTETVRAWKMYWPMVLPLPHPSPRNNLWLKKNPWFERDVVPELKKAVSGIL